MAKLSVRDGYVDRYNSLESLLKANGGRFKSEQQLAFFRDLGNAFLGDPSGDPSAAPVPGQFVVTVKLRSDDRTERATHEFQYLCDEAGIAGKYLVTIHHDAELGQGRKVHTRWTRGQEVVS